MTARQERFVMLVVAVGCLLLGGWAMERMWGGDDAHAHECTCVEMIVEQEGAVEP